MKYTLGFYVDHTKKGIKGYYLVSDDLTEEYFADPKESAKVFLDRIDIKLKDVDPTTEVLYNIYR